MSKRRALELILCAVDADGEDAYGMRYVFKKPEESLKE